MFSATAASALTASPLASPGKMLVAVVVSTVGLAAS